MFSQIMFWNKAPPMNCLDYIPYLFFLCGPGWSCTGVAFKDGSMVATFQGFGTVLEQMCSHDLPLGWCHESCPDRPCPVEFLVCWSEIMTKWSEILLWGGCKLSLIPFFCSIWLYNPVKRYDTFFVGQLKQEHSTFYSYWYIQWPFILTPQSCGSDLMIKKTFVLFHSNSTQLFSLDRLCPRQQTHKFLVLRILPTSLLMVLITRLPDLLPGTCCSGCSCIACTSCRSHHQQFVVEVEMMSVTLKVKVWVPVRSQKRWLHAQ